MMYETFYKIFSKAESKMTGPKPDHVKMLQDVIEGVLNSSKPYEAIALTKTINTGAFTEAEKEYLGRWWSDIYVETQRSILMVELQRVATGGPVPTNIADSVEHLRQYEGAAKVQQEAAGAQAVNNLCRKTPVQAMTPAEMNNCGALGLEGTNQGLQNVFGYEA